MQTAQRGNTSIAQEDEQCLHRGSHHRTWIRVNAQCLLPMQALNTQDTSLYLELNALLSRECFANWFHWDRCCSIKAQTWLQLSLQTPRLGFSCLFIVLPLSKKKKMQLLEFVSCQGLSIS